MQKLVVNHFNQWLSDKPIGFQFTTYDILDRFKETVPKLTPVRGSLGRLVMQNNRVRAVGYHNGIVLYEVVA